MLEYLRWLSGLEGCQDFQSKGEVCSWSHQDLMTPTVGPALGTLTDFTKQREKCHVVKGGVPPDSSGQVRCKGEGKEEHTEKNEFESGVNVVSGFLLEKKQLAAGPYLPIFLLTLAKPGPGVHKEGDVKEELLGALSWASLPQAGC